MKNNLQYWEVPEIDLNLRHYSGSPSDAVKKMKLNIALYLSNSSISDENRRIYSAVYNALNYYRDISYLPPAEYQTGETFLNKTLKTFNEDYNYLAQKYNSSDSTKPPVITFTGRIKSPLSFIDKVKEKITDYLDEGLDLSYLNESLRDLIGMRVIVDPPEEVKKQGLQAESDFLYKVFYDLISHRGLNYSNPENAPYRFMPINTRHEPQKLEKIKERPEKKGFINEITTGKEQIFIPERRIPEIEDDAVDSILKDYNKYPKFSGYQSLHCCIIPTYSDSLEHLSTPDYIISSKSPDYSFEYQFRTKKQDVFCEYGLASHTMSYKPNRAYHRLAVPFYLCSDSSRRIFK